MSKPLDRKMSPLGTAQTIADRVAETLNIIHDFEPIQPTGKSLEWGRLGKTDKYDPEDERDVSMVTQISGGLVYAVAFSKALDVTDSCEARTKFMEQFLRAKRSEKGWAVDKSIEMLKAVRPQQDEGTTTSRMDRLKNIFR